MFNLDRVAFCALAALASLPVMADPAAVPAPVSKPAPQAPVARPVPSAAASEIAAVNERLAVMSARLAELELQAKIAAKKSEISKVNAPSFVDESFTPSVSEIGGIDGKIWAKLVVQGGNTQTVRVGDRAGAWRVIGIRPDSVTVQRNGETLHLPFGSYTPSAQASGGQPPLPPYPVR